MSNWQQKFYKALYTLIVLVYIIGLAALIIWRINA